MNKTVLIGSVLLLLAAASCKSIKNGFVQEPKPNLIHNVADNMNDVNKILYGQWVAMSVNGEAVTGTDRPYIGFEANPTNPFLAKFFASNGCNVINGEVALTPQGSMKKANEYISTMKFCPDAKYELGFTMVLENIATYKIEVIGNDYLLYLYAGDTQQYMVLRRSDMSYANGAWAVVKIGDIQYNESVGMQMVIDVPELRLHANTGCNIINGDLIIDQDLQHSMSFTNLGMTRRGCDDPVREQSLYAALQQVRIAKSGGDNILLLCNKEGQTLIKLERINLTGAVELDD